MVKDYLNSLKSKGSFTCAELSNLSGLPEGTIRKILSGETPDPRFETVAKLVSAMGGSLDEVVERKKGEEIEISSILALKESYEARLIDYKEQITSLRKDRKALAWAVVALMAVVAGLLIFDVALGSHGWVQY